MNDTLEDSSHNLAPEIGVTSKISAGNDHGAIPSADLSWANDAVTRWIVPGLVIVALTLRLAGLSRAGFDQDELATIHFSMQPLHRVLFGPGFDNHPPLYYAVMHIWLSLFGVNEVALRLPSVLAGTTAVWLAFVVGRLLMNTQAGWAGAAGLALLPLHIAWSQNGRMFEFQICFTLLSIGTMARLVAHPDLRRLLEYVIATELMIYTQSVGVFVVVAENIFWLSAWLFQLQPHRSPRHDRLWITAQMAIVALHVPWIIVALGRLAVIQNNFWAERESIASYMARLFVFYTGVWIYPNLNSPIAFLLSPIMALLIGLALWRTVSKRSEPGGSDRLTPLIGVGLAATIATLPALLIATVSQVEQPIFVSRTLQPFAVPCYWLVGYSLSMICPPARLSLVVVLSVAVLAGTIQFEYWGLGNTLDVRVMLRRLAGEVRPGDTIYLHGWPETKDYATLIWRGMPTSKQAPLVLTSRSGDLESGLTDWCGLTGNRRFLVMFVGEIRYGFDGLIRSGDYASILQHAGLRRGEAIHLSPGEVEIWRCDRAVGASRLLKNPSQ